PERDAHFDYYGVRDRMLRTETLMHSKEVSELLKGWESPDPLKPHLIPVPHFTMGDVKKLLGEPRSWKKEILRDPFSRETWSGLYRYSMARVARRLGFKRKVSDWAFDLDDLHFSKGYSSLGDKSPLLHAKTLFGEELAMRFKSAYFSPFFMPEPAPWK